MKTIKFDSNEDYLYLKEIKFDSDDDDLKEMKFDSDDDDLRTLQFLSYLLSDLRGEGGGEGANWK